VTDQLILELTTGPAPTLDNFVAGRNTRIVTALRAAALGESRDSLYLWGESGSGRSHLLAATVRAARAAGREDSLITIDNVELLDAERQVQAFDAFNTARTCGLVFLAAGNAAPRELAVREDLRTRLLARKRPVTLPLVREGLAALGFA
jgi:DnaA family protein